MALSWKPVAGADAYQLYRQVPGEVTLSAYRQVSATTTEDTPTEEGVYRYAIASIRGANGQESHSTPSPAVEVTTDAGRPAAPVNLTLELIGAGIKALWDAPAGVSETLSYTLYRRSGTTLTDLTGLTPVQRNIVADGQERLGYIDTHPDKDQAVYAVTAVDSVGNESPPSEAHYLNIDLLPVATLQVRQEDQNPPQIEWSHTGGNIAGYQLYLDDQTTPLTAG